MLEPNNHAAAGMGMTWYCRLSIAPEPPSLMTISRTPLIELKSSWFHVPISR
jgi:hypothetical protein